MPQIRLSTGQSGFACADDDTVLRAALRAGLGFPYECNVGSCGNCKFELLEGQVNMAWPEAPGWTEKDRQRQRYLGCQARPQTDCVIKLNLADRYQPPHRPLRTRATLAAVRPITHDISEFRFVLPQPQPFEPGQYAVLSLPGVAGRRAYSMSNVPGDDPVWEFQVRRTPAGSGTRALFENLAPGDSIEIDGPYGMAWLRRDAPRDILCLAGGSGLAPMISIARAAMAEPMLAKRQLHFLYGGREPRDICGEDLLRQLPGWGSRLHYMAAVSSAGDGSDWSGPTGFVHDMAQQQFGGRLAGMEIYFAGPPAMAQAVQRMLLEAGVLFSQVHFDQFY